MPNDDKEHRSGLEPGQFPNIAASLALYVLERGDGIAAFCERGARERSQ